MCSVVNSSRDIIELVNSKVTLINNMLFLFLNLNPHQKCCRSEMKCKAFLFKACSCTRLSKDDNNKSSLISRKKHFQKRLNTVCF